MGSLHYSNGHFQKTKIGFQDTLSLNAGQKYCIMLQGEHSAILSTFIKLQFVIKNFVLSIFEWSFYTGFTIYEFLISRQHSGVISLLIGIHCVDPDQLALSEAW